MDQWWRRSGITMSDEEKKDVEDITGCIPLLLDKCMVNGKLDINAPILQDIYDSASNFAQDIYTKTEATRWRGDLYVRFLFDAQDLTDFTLQVLRLRDGLLP